MQHSVAAPAAAAAVIDRLTYVTRHGTVHITDSVTEQNINQNAFQSKADHPHAWPDLYLDPVNLILESDHKYSEDVRAYQKWNL